MLCETQNSNGSSAPTLAIRVSPPEGLDSTRQRRSGGSLRCAIADIRLIALEWRRDGPFKVSPSNDFPDQLTLNIMILFISSNVSKL
jgi:hypothetical protein